jgi:hypothetical protein
MCVRAAVADHLRLEPEFPQHVLDSGTMLSQRANHDLTDLQRLDAARA